MNDNFKENTQYEVDTCPIPNSQNLTIEASMNRSTRLHEVLNKFIIIITPFIDYNICFQLERHYRAVFILKIVCYVSHSDKV